MGTVWHDIVAARVGWAILYLGQVATVRVPQTGEDDVGQPVDTFAEHPGIPAYLASTPHPQQRETGRVQEDTDWRWFYMMDNQGVDLKPGYEVEVFDPHGQSLGVFEVEGDVSHRPGHYRARVRRKR